MKRPIFIVGAIIVSFLLGLFFEKIRSPKMPVIVSVSAQDFQEEVEDKNAVVLDIRTPEEFNNGRIKGAINIDYYKPDFRDKLSELDKDKPYKIYCNSGNRSGKTLQLMKEMGFTDVTELSGGIQAWISNNFSTCVNC